MKYFQHEVEYSYYSMVNGRMDDLDLLVGITVVPISVRSKNVEGSDSDCVLPRAAVSNEAPRLAP